MDIDDQHIERAQLTASSSTPPERAFADLARRLMARSTTALGRSAPAGISGITAGATWASLTGKASANPVFPQISSFQKDVVRLVNRISGSFDLQEYNLAEQQIAASGFQGYLDYHLNWQSISNDRVTEFILGKVVGGVQVSPPSHIFMQHLIDPMMSALALYLVPGDYTEVFQEYTLANQILTSRRLVERMVEFWSDHFSVDIRKDLVLVFKIVEDRSETRLKSLSTFRELLYSSALGPAMLWYLDNAANGFTPGAPNGGYNENYAREFFELHTLGIGSGYSEPDIRAAAAAWAGHTVSILGASPGQYYFEASAHDQQNPTTKILQATQNSVKIDSVDPISLGANQARDIIDGCHSHPDTIQFVGNKLMRWLLRYDPQHPNAASVRTALTAAWDSTQGAIPNLLHVILTQQTLADTANSPYAPKLKRPQQFATGLARALGVELQPVTGLQQGLNRLLIDITKLGHAPYYWGPPDGYPDSEAAWLGGLFGRWEIADKLLRSDGTGTGTDRYDPELSISDLNLSALFGGVPYLNWADRLSEVLTGDQMTSSEKAAIQGFLNVNPGFLPGGTVQELITWIREGVALAACCPTYQYY